MTYKFMEIADLYSEYITFFEKNNDISSCSYDEMHQKILDDSYVSSDFILRYFREELGIETMHVFYNYKKLQDKWDSEKDKNPISILLRQIKHFSPDVIFMHDLRVLNREQIQIIRDMLGHKVHFTCYHFTIIDRLCIENIPEYDLIFTGSKYWVDEFRKYTKNVYLSRHVFEPSILTQLSSHEVINKIAFMGSIMLGKIGHVNRLDTLFALYKNGVDFDYYGKMYGSFYNPRHFLYHILKEPLKFFNRLRAEPYIKQISKPSLFGVAYYNCMSKYSINLNVHADINPKGCGNVRMFEVTGVGSCLVTDYREENALLFEDGYEIVVYKNQNELIEKLKYLLDHPDKAKQIAENGQKRTLRDYNFRSRAMLMNECIQKIL